MGRTPPTDRAHSQLTAAIKCCSHSVGLPIRSWHLWLQQNAVGTNGVSSSNPPEQWEKGNMGSKCDRQMVLTNISQTLLVPYCVCKKHKKWKGVRHSTFQAQIHHITHPNARGHNYEGSQWSNSGIEREEEQERHRINWGIEKDRWTTHKVPKTITTPQPPQAITENRWVTFAVTSKPPHETQPTQRETNKRPTPRVVTPRPSITNTTVNKPTPPKNTTTKCEWEYSPESIKLKQYIRDATNSRARIPQGCQMNLCRQDHIECT